jgi:hypothetical protein
LVGAEVLALEKDELIFVRQVQGPYVVLSDAEVESLDALGTRVGPFVTCRDEFGSTKADLVVKNGLIADEHLNRFRISLKVELVTLRVLLA